MGEHGPGDIGGGDGEVGDPGGMGRAGGAVSQQEQISGSSYKRAVLEEGVWTVVVEREVDPEGR